MRTPTSVAVVVLGLATGSVVGAAEPDPLRTFERRLEQERVSPFAGMPIVNIGPTEPSGRVVDVEVPDPDAPSVWLVAYATGGIFRTVDDGANFEPLFDAQPTLVMGDLAVDPTNPQVIWAGTGEAHASRSTVGGAGIWVSRDGGTTWRHAGLAETRRIGRIAVHPSDPDTVLVAAHGPLWRDSPDRGVYRTTDGGRTWRRTLYIDERTSAADLVLHPTDPDVVYAATWTRSRREWSVTTAGAGSGVWRSDDRGVTWRRLGGGLPQGDHVGRIGLAVSAAAPDLVYAVVDDRSRPAGVQANGDLRLELLLGLEAMTDDDLVALDDSDLELLLAGVHPCDTPRTVRELIRRGALSAGDIARHLRELNVWSLTPPVRGAELYRSTDRGATWTRRDAGDLGDLHRSFGHYFATVAVSPADPDTVYLLGVPLLKSTDGGRGWTELGDERMHADHHVLWIDPRDPDRLIDGNDGGVDLSRDGGATWTGLDTVSAAQVYFLTVDTASPYRVYVGLQDTGIWSGPRTQAAGDDGWRFIDSGDGMYVRVDPGNDQVVIAGAQYGQYQATDHRTGEGWPVRAAAHLWQTPDRFGFEAPLEMSPHDARVLYLGSQRLYRSDDRGRTFHAVSGDLTGDRQPRNVMTPFSTISAIAESSRSRGELWVGTDDGRLWRSPDRGGRWTDVSRGLEPGIYVSRVVASRHHDGRAYASQNGSRHADSRALVFRTDDRGATWRPIGAGLPDETVHVIAEDPRHADVLYLGSDLGAWISVDGGLGWQPVVGLPRVAVRDLVVHPRERELVVGTHGRGVFVVGLGPLDAAVTGDGARGPTVAAETSE